MNGLADNNVCSYCGEKIEQIYNYCPFCGKIIEKDSNEGVSSLGDVRQYKSNKEKEEYDFFLVLRATKSLDEMSEEKKPEPSKKNKTDDRLWKKNEPLEELQKPADSLKEVRRADYGVSDGTGDYVITRRGFGLDKGIREEQLWLAYLERNAKRLHDIDGMDAEHPMGFKHREKTKHNH